jgi:hypothetical protein
MTAVSEMGGIIFPPVPAFYVRPKSIDDLVAHPVGRVLDLFGRALANTFALAGDERESAGERLTSANPGSASVPCRPSSVKPIDLTNGAT